MPVARRFCRLFHVRPRISSPCDGLACNSQQLIRTNVMNNNKAAQFPFSFHDAKDYLMEWPLQSWPKIPRRYPVTRYDKLAEILVSHPYTWVVNVRPVDCQIVERVFGLKLSIKDNETLWPSTRRLALR